MLARPDMIESFRAIFNSQTANFELRSVVVDALAAGAPMPAMATDLAAVLAGEQSPFRERARAMTALSRLGQPGTDALLAFCKGNPPADRERSAPARANCGAGVRDVFHCCGYRQPDGRCHELRHRASGRHVFGHREKLAGQRHSGCFERYSATIAGPARCGAATKASAEQPVAGRRIDRANSSPLPTGGGKRSFAI